MPHPPPSAERESSASMRETPSRQRWTRDRPASGLSHARAFDAIVLGRYRRPSSHPVHPALRRTLRQPALPMWVLGPCLPWSASIRGRRSPPRSRLELSSRADTQSVRFALENRGLGDLPRHERATALNRLILLAAAKEVKLAESFARRRTGGSAEGPDYAAPSDWLARQDAGFQATFRCSLHYCGAVWPV